ncbi:MAG: transglycosylase domain-containing protein [Patescibacteria group bacterium]
MVKKTTTFKSKVKKFFKKYPLKNWIFGILAAGIFLFGAAVIWVSTLKIPDFKTFTEQKIQSSTKIYDRTGEILLYNANQDLKRTVIPYEAMGTNIKNATVAIEDSEFYNHKGIRITSIFRATVWAKLTGRRIQGGSTITQQLIKNTLLTPKRTLSRKIKEWMLALKLERVMEKDEILALYLNAAPYGGSLYGIEEASKAFFGKDPSLLSLPEAAYLAAIPNSPTYYSPYGKNKARLDERKNLVLRRMRDLSFITEEQYNQAVTEVVVFEAQQPTHIAAPHFVFYVMDYLREKYGEEAVSSGGLKVITTLDFDLQKKAEEITLARAKENERDWNGENAAVVAIDSKTGQVLSMIGSRDYFDKTIDGNFNVATAARQPGSSFKPIVYAQAFKEGYNESTVLFDVKTEFNSSCSPSGTEAKSTCYHPDNYDNSFRGPMNLKDGLAQSINVIAVKVLYLAGVPDSIKMAHDLGITTLNDPTRYGLSLVIGGGETTLLDMTSAYSVFANNGIRHPNVSVLSVTDQEGTLLEEYKETFYQVLDSKITRQLSDILSDNAARTPTFGANSPLVIPGRDVAVKTGTTNNNKDAWTIGYTPSIAVGVWVGNNDNTPMKKGGSALAGPIWNGVMTEALKTRPVETFDEPDPIDPSLPPIIRGFWQGGETFKIDTVSGALATDYTPTDNTREQSITNVHTILYWIDKNDPLGPRPLNPEKDSQFKSWEYGVQNWWTSHMSQYPIITNATMPATYDTLHTNDSKPVFQVDGISSEPYGNDRMVEFSIYTQSIFPIKKIDVFVNNTYMMSLRTVPYLVRFTPDEIEDIKANNTVRIIGYDTMGNIGEITAPFSVK